jgi:hypothetical protein
MQPLASAPPAAPLPRRSEVGEGGGLVVLLLAERAPSEGPSSTRAIEDRPGHLLEKQTSKLGGTIVRETRARMESSLAAPAQVAQCRTLP